MRFAWTYLFVLLWLAYMIISGVVLFSRGFLLSRVSKKDVSNCRRLSLDPNANYPLTDEIVQEIFKDVNATSNLCLPPKSKVIVLLIDALKYEFGLWHDRNTTHPAAAFENKLPVLQELLKATPQQARLMRFKADPPTTTLQRLKGLTTGSLPTFVDIGSNFATAEINEDNIIDQMVRHDVPVVFMGDSTWTDLYPRRFRRAYAYPSFDIFDLDTVDQKIRLQLPKELERADWEVLIAHFLGVDHCGHKHGPMHAEMTRKLSEMDEVIRSVIAQMDNETTLLVMGDHGMTASGDHGGDTDDETNALMFAYHKSTPFISGELSGSDVAMLQQIDLVPTLATILGLPVPYSNLGLVNFNLVPDVAVPHMSRHQTLLLHAWQNAQQIYQYFYGYALENKRTFRVEHMDRLETDFILLTHRVKTIYNEPAYRSFVADLSQHLRQILSTCRELWVRFDATQMSHGLLFTLLPVFFVFLLVNNSRPLELHKIFLPHQVFYTLLLNFAAGVFGYRYFRNFSFRTEEHGVIFFTNIVSTLVLVYHTVQHWSHIAENWSQVRRLGHLGTRLMLVLLMSVFFSNSFVVQEARILSYLLVGLLLLLVWELWQKSVRVDFRTRFRPAAFWRSTALKLILASALAVVLVRSSSRLFRCREEQGNCDNFGAASGSDFSVKSPASGSTYFLAVGLIVVYTTLTRLYLRSCGNLTGNAPNVLLARYGPTVASICAGGHILLANSSIRNIQRSHVDAMALLIYGLILLQIVIFGAAPLMVYVLPPKRTTATTITVDPTKEGGGVVPQLFRRMKRMYDGDEADRRYEIPVVYGLATIYSAILIAFGVFLAMLLIVLLEPKAAIGLLICIAVAAILLSVHAVLRFRTAVSFETCIQPTFTAVAVWFVLAHFCFFATSHQTTLSQIDWRAAFVGRTTGLGQSHFISGFLVLLNTFCGHVFFFTMYALLGTETFSVFALFPHLIKTNCNREQLRKQNDAGTPAENAARLFNGSAASGAGSQRTSLDEISNECVGFDMTRGELILFENEVAFLGGAFKLAAQFFILQGLRIFCAMLACTIHCRHLMVWKIFAPRFIYESLATFISLPALILGYALLLRIHWAVDRLIRRINKIK